VLLVCWVNGLCSIILIEKEASGICAKNKNGNVKISIQARISPFFSPRFFASLILKQESRNLKNYKIKNDE